MKKSDIICPYCSKTNFIPKIVYEHIKRYGNGIKNFKCLYCQKVIKACGYRKIFIIDIQKTNNKSDFGF